MKKNRRKKGFERRVVCLRPDQIARNPILHRHGLSPLLTDLARRLYRRIGHLQDPTFEQWETGLLRNVHPWREILAYEAICRAHEEYLSKHPGADKTTIYQMLCGLSLGGQVQATNREKQAEVAAQAKELRRLLGTANSKRWTPLFETPVQFPKSGAIVMEFQDVIDYYAGVFAPSLTGPFDPRCVIPEAELILGIDCRHPDHQFILFGRDVLERIAAKVETSEGKSVLMVALDQQNTKTMELEKICAAVEVIKGRCDYNA